MADPVRVVLCMKWGALYSADYVNILHSACSKFLDKPFRFVCLTNETDGLAEGIETFPMPDLGLDQDRHDRGAWPKLGVFQKDLYGLEGRCLFIDLDSVVVSSLEPFFEAEGDLITIAGGKTWYDDRENPNPTVASGVFVFNLGQQAQVFDSFMANKEDAFNRFANEQQVLEHYAQGDRRYWPFEWVVSFKKHLRQPVILDRFLAPKHFANSTKIVAFHGDPRPVDLVDQKSMYWTKFPRAVRKPVAWVRNYWLEHGFKD